jgi:hypothetical protein
MNAAALNLVNAWTYAQQCFVAMLDARSYDDPQAPETLAYIAAERAIDELLVEMQGRRAFAETDAVLSGDNPDGASYHDWQAVR